MGVLVALAVCVIAIGIVGIGARAVPGGTRPRDDGGDDWMRSTRDDWLLDSTSAAHVAHHGAIDPGAIDPAAPIGGVDAGGCHDVGGHHGAVDFGHHSGCDTGSSGGDFGGGHHHD